MREVQEISPTQIRRRSDKTDEPSPTEKLRRALGAFADVRGPEEAEEPILTPNVRGAIFGWLSEINAAKELKAVNVEPRRTALMFGPPGCGKTTLAHHLGMRLGIPLVSIKSEGLVGSHLGDTSRNISKAFETIAAAKTRCILFFDEIDSIGSARSGDDQACAREMNSALTVLLRKVEQFDGIMAAATNRADALDAALWRRFGMQIEVSLPGPDERFAILARYAAPYDLGEDLLEALTDMTAGAAPSLLRQLMEGMKRALVLGARLRMATNTPQATLGLVTAQCKPHPAYEPPLLWSSPDALSLLPETAWPPEIVREAA